jgi:hypothetical protein
VASPPQQKNAEKTGDLKTIATFVPCNLIWISKTNKNTNSRISMINAQNRRIATLATASGCPEAILKNTITPPPLTPGNQLVTK